jgi:hypothetical protein
MPMSLTRTAAPTTNRGCSLGASHTIRAPFAHQTPFAQGFITSQQLEQFFRDRMLYHKVSGREWPLLCRKVSAQGGIRRAIEEEGRSKKKGDRRRRRRRRRRAVWQ